MEVAYGEVDTMAQQELTSGTLACNDSLSQFVSATSKTSRVFVDANPDAGQPIQLLASSDMGRRALVVDESAHALLLFNVDAKKTICRWSASS